MGNGTLKELTTADMAKIIYNSGREIDLVTQKVTTWPPFDSLEMELVPLFVSQVEAIINNIRLRPHELHQHFKVTAQQMIANLAPAQNILDKLEPYMIPFQALSEIEKTKFRLQVQLARVLMRHNRNVKRAEKRQR